MRHHDSVPIVSGTLHGHTEIPIATPPLRCLNPALHRTMLIVHDVQRALLARGCLDVLGLPTVPVGVGSDGGDSKGGLGALGRIPVVRIRVINEVVVTTRVATIQAARCTLGAHSSVSSIVAMSLTLPLTWSQVKTHAPHPRSTSSFRLRYPKGKVRLQWLVRALTPSMLIPGGDA